MPETRAGSYTNQGVDLVRSVFEDDGCFFLVPATDGGPQVAVFSDGSFSPYWTPSSASRSRRARRWLGVSLGTLLTLSYSGSLLDVA